MKSVISAVARDSPHQAVIRADYQRLMAGLAQMVEKPGERAGDTIDLGQEILYR